MNQQETFAGLPPSDVRAGRTGWAQFRDSASPPSSPVPRNVIGAAFMLARAVTILEGLVESPTDAIDIQLAEEFLADYRKWRDS